MNWLLWAILIVAAVFVVIVVTSTAGRNAKKRILREPGTGEADSRTLDREHQRGSELSIREQEALDAILEQKRREDASK